MKREDYKPITHYKECNRANEPVWNRLVDEKHMHYPDMAEVYDKFAKLFGLHKGTFILTSGCEESLRIALEIIKHNEENQKIRYKFIENPTWGLAEVIFNQVFYNDPDILKINYEENFIDKNYSVSDFILALNKEKIMDIHDKDNPTFYKNHYKDIIYHTETFSNITYHESNLMSDLRFNQYEFYIIEDQEYTLSSLFGSNGNFTFGHNFYIGGFSKVFGPGYRLGYLIFGNEFKDLANLYRPQYISKDAIDLIDFMGTVEGKFIINDYENRLIKCISENRKLRELPNDGKPKDYNKRIYTTLHPNYISMEFNSFLRLKLFQEMFGKYHFPVYNDIPASEYKRTRLDNGIELIRIPVPKDINLYEDMFSNYEKWFDVDETRLNRSPYMDRLIRDPSIVKRFKKNQEVHDKHNHIHIPSIE